MMIRAAPPSIRQSLVARLMLPDVGDSMKDVKQFMCLFKRAPPGCALLVSKKGMAAVEFALHSHNSCKPTIRQHRGLKKAAEVFFRWHPDHPQEMKLEDTVSVINGEIRINGKSWYSGEVAEYLATKGAPRRGSEENKQKLDVGRIHSFIVVSFAVAGAWRHGDHEKDTTLFVRFRKFAKRSISLAGPPGCGHYRVHKERCTTATRYVHVTALTTQYATMPDNRGQRGVQLLQSELENVPDECVYLVPCARAFEE